MVRFASPAPYPVLQILSKNLKHNLKVIRQHIGKAKILIPVKANAYGCGLSQLIPFFIKEEIDYLGVANPHEGVLARSFGYQGEILNLGAFFKENIDLFFNHDIQVAITDLWQIPFLEKKAREKKQKIKVHIKWDLGMGRLGLKKENFQEACSLFLKSPNISIRGLFTHFPCADSHAKRTLKQLSEFLAISDSFMTKLSLDKAKVILHVANSYALMLYPETHLDMVRPGIFFYGYFQSEKDRKKYFPFFPIKPSLRLLARPFSLRILNKGDTVSYGSTYTCPKNNYPVGVFPIGYADGIPRALSNKKISFSGHPLLGRVTMDQIILGNVTTDNPIEILGESEPTLEKWGDLSCSFSYEILTGLGHRLRRELV